MESLRREEKEKADWVPHEEPSQRKQQVLLHHNSHPNCDRNPSHGRYSRHGNPAAAITRRKCSTVTTTDTGTKQNASRGSSAIIGTTIASNANTVQGKLDNRTSSKTTSVRKREGRTRIGGLRGLIMSTGRLLPKRMEQGIPLRLGRFLPLGCQVISSAVASGGHSKRRPWESSAASSFPDGPGWAVAAGARFMVEQGGGKMLQGWREAGGNAPLVLKPRRNPTQPQEKISRSGCPKPVRARKRQLFCNS